MITATERCLKGSECARCQCFDYPGQSWQDYQGLASCKLSNIDNLLPADLSRVTGQVTRSQPMLSLWAACAATHMPPKHKPGSRLFSCRRQGSVYCPPARSHHSPRQARSCAMLTCSRTPTCQ